jgi:hypothetical protein
VPADENPVAPLVSKEKDAARGLSRAAAGCQKCGGKGGGLEQH